MVSKIHPEALIPLRGSYVDVFPFLTFFILLFLSLFFILKVKRPTPYRRTIQVISLFLFIYFTQERFCFIRNAFLFGIPLIGREELLSFGYLILFIFVFGFSMLFGRIFCGWVCPFGFLQDASFFFNRWISKVFYLPILALGIVGAAVYINRLRPSQDMLPQFIPNFLALLLIVLLFVSAASPRIEERLRKIRFVIFFGWMLLLFGKVYTFQPWCYLYGAKTGEYGILGALLIVIAGSLVFYRPYCRFICPVGVMLHFCSKASLLTLKRKGCTACMRCGEICLLKNIERGKVKSTEECILCGRCIGEDGFTASLR